MTTRSGWTGRIRGIGLGLAILLAGCSLDPFLLGQWYWINVPRTGACGPLQWHFVVNAQRLLAGTVADADGRVLATLSGPVAADDSFVLGLFSQSGGRAGGSMTGRFTTLVSTIAIHGEALGSGCDDQTIRLRLAPYFRTQGGGGGGGG